MSVQQLLGFGRDLFLIAATTFFSAFITWQIARRRFGIRGRAQAFQQYRAATRNIAAEIIAGAGYPPQGSHRDETAEASARLCPSAASGEIR